MKGKTALIIGAAPEQNLNYLEQLVRYACPDLIVCADGGLKNAIKMNIKPNIIIGDMDSFDGELEEYKKSMEIIRLPREKDYTDLKEAVDKVLDLNIKHIYIACVSDGRLDHYLANLYLLEYLEKNNCTAQIYSQKNITAFYENPIINMSMPDGFTYFSIIPVSSELTHVNLNGLKYELTDGVIERRTPISVSNETNQQSFKISFDGQAFLIFSRD